MVSITSSNTEDTSAPSDHDESVSPSRNCQLDSSHDYLPFCAPPLNSAAEIYCERHGCRKTYVLWKKCQERGKYWDAWEQGRGPGQHQNVTGTSPKSRKNSFTAKKPSCCGGPGTELKAIIAWWQRRFPWFDLSPGKGCKCDATARWMDRLGPDGCTEVLDKIVKKLDAEAKKRNLSIPFQRHWARLMVKQAIRRAKAKAKARNPI